MPIVFADKKLMDLLPSAITSEIQRPNQEEIENSTKNTLKELEMLTKKKISSALPVRCGEKQTPTRYIRYTPSIASESQQKIIRMYEIQCDPLAPAKFKINKKVPRRPPSPPAPVMHSPSKKLTVKDQQEWRIPPCVSNWKNAKGYIIPLDKRLAADGQHLKSVHINENFARLSEALYISDRKVRDEVEMRSRLERKMAMKERTKKEENLKLIAKKARDENSGIKSSDEAEKERQELRRQLQRDRKRRVLVEGKNKKAAHKRDISEQIALGLPHKTALFDQRLFDQSRGIDSGFGNEETYNVYDKSWRDASTSTIYHPRNIESEDLQGLLKTKRFVPDCSFSGAENSEPRNGPLEFESATDEDLFGVFDLFSEARKSSKRKLQHTEERSQKRMK